MLQQYLEQKSKKRLQKNRGSKMFQCAKTKNLGKKFKKEAPKKIEALKCSNVPTILGTKFKKEAPKK